MPKKASAKKAAKASAKKAAPTKASAKKAAPKFNEQELLEKYEDMDESSLLAELSAATRRASLVQKQVTKEETKALAIAKVCPAVHVPRLSAC